MSVKILELQKIIKRLESELHDCCISALAIGDLATTSCDEGGNVECIVIDVNHACTMLYNKFDYRVSGYDDEDIIIDGVNLK